MLHLSKEAPYMGPLFIGKRLHLGLYKRAMPWAWGGGRERVPALYMYGGGARKRAKKGAGKGAGMRD